MIFSVCMPAVLGKSDLSIEEKIKQIRDMDYRSIELWAWWNEDMEAIVALTKQYGLEIGSFCTRFVSLVDAAQRKLYLEGLKESIAAAEKAGCSYLISQTGGYIEDISNEKQEESLVEGLRAAVPLLMDAGMTLVVEPLNTKVDHPGYFLDRSEDAFRIIEAVGSKHVKVLYDVYHQQVTEGNLIPTIRKHIQSIGYFHIADHPGRHEPGTGEIHYANVLAAIKETGYSGHVGLEYFPQGDAMESLRRFAQAYRSFS